VIGRTGVGGLELFEDFVAQDVDTTRGLNAELDAIAIDTEDGDDDIVAQHHALLAFAAEDEHVC